LSSYLRNGQILTITDLNSSQPDCYQLISFCLKRSSSDWLSLYDVRMMRSCRYRKRAFHTTVLS